MTRIGWCPGGRTVADMLKLYPRTGAARLFYGFRDPVPTTWGGPDLDPLGLDVLAVLSFKVWDLPAMLALAGAIPPGVVVVLSYHHEDEQQDGGDIPPELFVARWVELARAFEGHPNRDQIILAPIFTRVWWEKHPGDLRYWPAEVAHLLDAVGWDVYNNGGSYRTPDDLLRIPREMAARTGLPYFVGELGAVRLAGDDGGAGRSAWMRAMVAAARADGALAVCWFHRDEWDLTGPASAGEQQTWRELIEQEASMTRIKTLAGRPIEQYDSPNTGGTMTGHKGIVLHIAEGTYRGTISWQMNPDQRYASGGTVTTSSTFIVGREPGEWAQMVDADQIAWCQRGGSYDWLSIELAGHAPDAPSAWQIEACAQLLAWANRTYGVPIQATSSTGTRGLGHHSMDNDTTVEWGHDSCPGAGVINAKSAIVARAKAIAAGEPVEDDMTPSERWVLHVMNYRLEAIRANRAVIKVPARTDLGPAYVAFEEPNLLAVAVGVDDADEQAIVAGVLAGLSPAAIAAAIPSTVAKQVADELAARLVS